MAKQFGATSTTDEVLEDVALRGKRFLVTGTSAGIGVETARSLAARGAEVIGAVRDLAKGEAATKTVREDAERNGGSFSQRALDLGDLKSVHACADALVAEGMLLDGVIANAGVMATPFWHTVDGFEMQFGTNYLGHFVLINRITALLRPGARVVSLTSAGHRFADVDLQDPNFECTPYDPFVAYGRSKTANILFTVAFDARQRPRGVRACAVNPGGVPTELGRYMAPGLLEAMVGQLNQQLAAEGKGPFQHKTLPQGAATSVWAAVTADADEIGARYCENCHVGQVVGDDVTLSIMSEGVRGYALDPEHAEALWKRSEEWVGERF